MMRLLIIVVSILFLLMAGAYVWLITVGSCYDMGGWWRYDERRCEYCVNGDGSRPTDPNPLCEKPPPEQLSEEGG